MTVPPSNCRTRSRCLNHLVSDRKGSLTRTLPPPPPGPGQPGTDRRSRARRRPLTRTRREARGGGSVTSTEPRSCDPGVYAGPAARPGPAQGSRQSPQQSNLLLENLNTDDSTMVENPTGRDIEKTGCCGIMMREALGDHPSIFDFSSQLSSFEDNNQISKRRRAAARKIHNIMSQVFQAGQNSPPSHVSQS